VRDTLGYVLHVPLRRLLFAAFLALVWLTTTPAHAQAPEDKALGRPATASSVEPARPGGPCSEILCAPGLATDGRDDTRWGSEFADNQWWLVDLGSARLVDSVSLTWHRARARRYVIETSLDGVEFTPAATVDLNLSDAQIATLIVNLHWTEHTFFPVRSARYVRVTSGERAPIVLDGQTQRFGVSLWTANVYGPRDDGPRDNGPGGTVSPPAPPPAGTPPATSPSGAADVVQGLIRPFPVVRIKGSLTERGARIDVLSVRAPRNATIRVRCRGRSCPDLVRRRPGGRRRIAELERALPAGTVVTVRVMRPGDFGKFTRFVIRRGRPPDRTDSCVRGVAPAPVACPDS
jgi:F5/8 type C domain